jgi:hypothetical protein
MDFQNKPLKKPEELDSNGSPTQNNNNFNMGYNNENQNQMNQESYSGGKRSRGHPGLSANSNGSSNGGKAA